MPFPTPAPLTTSTTFTRTSSARGVQVPISQISGRRWIVSATIKGAKRSIQAAIDAASSGDAILIAPGAWLESVTIPFGKSVSLTGVGPRGSVAIVPQTAGAEGLLVNANDVTMVNVGVAAPTGGDYAVKVTGSRFRAYGSKFEGADTAGYAFGFGPGTVAEVAAFTAGRGGDCVLDDCEFAWTFNGLTLRASDFGAATQVLVRNCWFHNTSNVALLGVPGAFGIGSSRNLNVEHCQFDRLEDGTKPADFVDVSTAFDTGLFADNYFALATNAAADLKIGANVYWSANKTEAGSSTARPA